MAGTQLEPGVREQQASTALVLQAAWRRVGRTDFDLAQHLTWAKGKRAGIIECQNLMSGNIRC